jgi:ribose/xylose/arabinose/galactoside ABC-type transport system permease subunit
VGTTLVIQLGSIDLSPQGVMAASGMAWILLSANTRLETDFGIWAWIIAIGAIPTIPVVLAIALTTDTTSEIASKALAYALVYGTPALIALAFLAGAWLVLGRPRTPAANN